MKINKVSEREIGEGKGEEPTRRSRWEERKKERKRSLGTRKICLLLRTQEMARICMERKKIDNKNGKIGRASHKSFTYPSICRRRPIGKRNSQEGQNKKRIWECTNCHQERKPRQWKSRNISIPKLQVEKKEERGPLK